MTYIPYLGTFVFSRYPSVALARNNYNYMAAFLMTATLKLTALALHSISIPRCRRPPPIPLMYIPT